jgi:hypothetical protein
MDRGGGLGGDLSLDGRGAEANIAGRGRYPGVAGRPALLRSTPLVVQRAELSFTCAEAGKRPSCELEASHLVHNPTSTRQEVVAAFYSLDRRPVSITVDGMATRRELTQAERWRADRGKRHHPVPRVRTAARYPTWVCEQGSRGGYKTWPVAPRWPLRNLS